jgi:glutathione S-transferase
VNWYLEEKNIPFTQKAPRPSPHPFGQTPCLTDDGGVEVFESGAILLYIADAYGGIYLLYLSFFGWFAFFKWRT